MAASSIVLLHGNDEFAIEARVEALRARLDKSSAAMNFSRLNGHSLDFEQLTAALLAAPFLAPRRLLVLDSPTTLPKDRLLALLENIPPTTEVALVETELLKAGHWLLKWAQRGNVAVEVYQLPRRWEMPRWIEQETKRQGGTIEPNAALRLAEMTGEDTRQAAQEITKLLTYVDGQRPIQVADVERLSVVSAQSSVFDFTDALAGGDGPKAQKTLHRLLEEEDPSVLWGMIIRQFRLLLLTREILDEGGNPSQVQNELLLPEFVAQKLIAQARRFSRNNLEFLYRILLEVDESSKTGQLPLEVALDVLVAQLAH